MPIPNVEYIIIYYYIFIISWSALRHGLNVTKLHCYNVTWTKNVKFVLKIAPNRREKFGGVLKFSYLCIVNRNDGF